MDEKDTNDNGMGFVAMLALGGGVLAGILIGVGISPLAPPQMKVSAYVEQRNDQKAPHMVLTCDKYKQILYRQQDGSFKNAVLLKSELEKSVDNNMYSLTNRQ